MTEMNVDIDNRGEKCARRRHRGYANRSTRADGLETKRQKQTVHRYDLVSVIKSGTPVASKLPATNYARADAARELCDTQILPVILRISYCLAHLLHWQF
jgi:hypothetical protein